MDDRKLTDGITSWLSGLDPDESLDVIIELNLEAGPESSRPLTREEQISARKEAFTKSAEEVEAVVRDVGGEVTARAWINSTLRSRVPARGVERISALDRVARLDVPHSIVEDAAESGP